MIRVTGNTVIVLDFETTGFSPDSGDRATEVAAVVIEGQRIGRRYHSLMNAGVQIPPDVQDLTGITNTMIQKAPPASEVIRELVQFIGAVPLIAHNASFDRRFLDSELGCLRRRLRQEIVCSMRVARRVYPNAKDHRLSTLARLAGIRWRGSQHRALADAMMTANLWLKMQKTIGTVYKLKSVPLDLMQRLQAIPCGSLDAFISRYREMNGI